MTFPGPEHAIPTGELPAAVAGSPPAVAMAQSLARALDWTPFGVTGDRRLYHAAAVIAGNFATTLLHEAAQLLVEAGAEPAEAARMLAPLALASIRNAAEKGPARTLTGPVARRDEAVIRAHREALAHRPAVRELYEVLVRATERMKAEEASRFSSKN
jgi:predicted short-subunit dehydrogenase-like oxidoreductase (DUF2520 family)